MPDSDPQKNLHDILDSPSYRLAYEDVEFLTSPGVRPLRMQLEFLKPELRVAAVNGQDIRPFLPAEESPEFEPAAAGV